MVHKYSELDLMQARIKEVPKGWSFLPIAKAFKIRNDLRKPISDEIRSTQQGIYPYYGPTKIQDYIDTYEQDGSFALIGEDGDHFLKYRSQSMTQLVDGKCTVNNHAHIIEGTDLASREWFYYYFMHRDIYSYLSRQGAGRYKLNKASLEKIYVLIPPSEEQKKIAQILSTWDQAISATEKLLKNSQEQKKALMQQLLTGKKRLLDDHGVRFSATWLSKSLKDISKVSIGLVTTMTEHYVESGIPLIRNSDIKENRITKEKLIKLSEDFANQNSGRKLSKGDVVTVHTGEVGVSAVIDDELDGCLGFATLNTRPNKKIIDAQFLCWYFNSSRFIAHCISLSTGDGRQNLNLKDFSKVMIPVPSLLEQKKIASALSLAAQEMETLQKKLDCLKQEKKALMQQLLTGKKRVKVAA